MPIPLFLAMSPYEFTVCGKLPPRVAWMSLRFSPSGQGLSNQPKALPPGSLMILDDWIPWHGHSSSRIAQELEQLLGRLGCCGLLLDFERPPQTETLLLANALSCLCKQRGIPMAAPPAYLVNDHMEVFLPPLPVLPRRNRDSSRLWVDVSPVEQSFKIGPDMTEPLPPAHRYRSPQPQNWQHSGELPMLYRTYRQGDAIVLHLRRDPSVVRDYLCSQTDCRIRFALGLWKEFLRLV